VRGVVKFVHHKIWLVSMLVLSICAVVLCKSDMSNAIVFLIGVMSYAVSFKGEK
jgi:hypothetical protein